MIENLQEPDDRSRRTPTGALVVALLALIVVSGCLSLERHVFGGIPHGWDALSYHFQARLIANGRLSTPPTPMADHFRMLHVVERADGSRYSIYPPGWPILLAVTLRLGYGALANAVLAGLAVWLTWLVGRRCFEPSTALLAAVLLPLSPFFMFMGSSYTSHMAAAVALLTTLHLLLRSLDSRGLRSTLLWGLAAGIAAGSAFLIRPYSAILGTIGVTAIAIAVSDRRHRKWLSAFSAAGLSGFAVALLYLVYNQATTGDPFLPGYRVLFPNLDFLGFDQPIRPSLWANIAYNGPYTVENFNREAWGWPIPDLSLLVLGLLVLRKSRVMWSLAAASALYVTGQSAYYWSDLYFGPRMVFEALPWIALGSAASVVASIRGLVREPHAAWRRRLALAAAAALLAAGAWRLYPALTDYYRADYCGQSPALVQEVESRDLENAVVFLEADSDVAFGTLFPLNSLDPSRADVVFARFSPDRWRAFAEAYPREENWLLTTKTSLLPDQRNIYPDRFRLEEARWQRLQSSSSEARTD